MSPAPATIAVDLTPLLPGGENGGAKVFVLELLRGLAVHVPQCRFVLLTRAESHEELAALDGPNVERVLVLDAAPAAGGGRRAAGLERLARALLRRLPGRVRALVARVGYRVRRYGKRSGNVALLRKLGAELLYCPFGAPTYAEPHVPVVCTIHDLQYKTYPQFFDAADVAHRDQVFRDACREATLMAAVSDYARDSAIHHGRLDPSRVVTIHHRLAGRLLPSAAPDLSVLDRFGLQPGRYLLYPANFWRHKNHEMLLTAFGVAARRGLPAELRLVCTGAPGERSDFLRRAAAQMGLAERVLFPGYVPAPELAGLLGNAAGVVFPSLYEGFGIPVVEAMACGVPVACSNRTSLPEVAAGAARLFDPRVVDDVAAAIVELAADSPARAELVAAGRRRAADFADAGRMAAEYWALFCKAVSGKECIGSIRGVYGDGWMGCELVVEIGASSPVVSVDMEFSAPGWIPWRELQLALRGNQGRDSGRLRVKRGETAHWSLPAAVARGGRMIIKISPSFSDSDFSAGDDRRERTLLLLGCELRYADGSSRSLYARDAAA